MPIVRNFSTYAGHYAEIMERDVARLVRRESNSDDKEVFALQVNTQDGKLTVVGILLARPAANTIIRVSPGTLKYAGVTFAIGEDLLKKTSGEPAMDAFIAHIREACAAVTA